MQRVDVKSADCGSEPIKKQPLSFKVQVWLLNGQLGATPRLAWWESVFDLNGSRTAQAHQCQKCNSKHSQTNEALRL